MRRATSVDDYIAGARHWRDELVKLRKILNATRLAETVKWGGPCYTCAGRNVVGLGAFKSYVGLWFYQGALLSDPDQVLINAQAGKTRGLRQWRFASMRDIRVRAVTAYVNEAIELALAGDAIEADRDKPVVVPAELKTALAQNKKTAAAFHALTKGKKREYAEYLADAKRPDTRSRRLDKILPMIAAGRGLHDKYRNR